jgi:hypothetical protein
VSGVKESQEIVSPILERGSRVLSSWSWLIVADLTKQIGVTKPTVFVNREIRRTLCLIGSSDPKATSDLIVVA